MLTCEEYNWKKIYGYGITMENVIDFKVNRFRTRSLFFKQDSQRPVIVSAKLRLIIGA